jgi:hypothetical protein
MLRGSVGMSAERDRISRQVHKDGSAVSDAHALAQGEADGMKKPKRPPVSPDKPRDLEEEVEKGNKKRLAEFRDRLGRLEYHHGELMHSLNPSHDPSILPSGQPENPEPCEMVDPVAKTATNMEAVRNPGKNLPGEPKVMHSPDGTQSKHGIPGRPVHATAEFTCKNPV